MGNLIHHKVGFFIVLYSYNHSRSPIHLQSSLPLSHQRHPWSIPGSICHRLSNPDHAPCTVLHPQAPYLRSATLRDLSATQFVPPTQMPQL